jgi:hypothetical protein
VIKKLFRCIFGKSKKDEDRFEYNFSYKPPPNILPPPWPPGYFIKEADKKGVCKENEAQE